MNSWQEKKQKEKLLYQANQKKRSDSVCYIFIYDDYNECEKMKSYQF